MTTEDAILEATEHSEDIKQLAPLPMRSKKAKVIEFLARRCVDLPKQHPSRAAYLSAILELTSPLLKRVFFESSLPSTDVQLDDFLQDSGEKIITLVNRYYDPHRGTFASFVVMAGRQTVFRMRNDQAAGRSILSFRDGLGFEDHDSWNASSEVIRAKHDPVYEAVTGTSQLLLLVRKFYRKYLTRSGPDPKVVAILQVLCKGPKLVALPKLSHLAKLLNCAPSAARKQLLVALVQFRLFLTSLGIESVTGLETWVPANE